MAAQIPLGGIALADYTTKQDMAHAYAKQRKRLAGIASRAGSLDAEDIVRDTFVKVIELSQRQDVRTLDRILSRVARYLAIDRRRRRTARSTETQADFDDERGDATVNPERTLTGEKAFWSRIGAAWPHKDGNGFSIKLESFPLNGRIQMRSETGAQEGGAQ
ncbi:MAG TPA: sigma factor [Hyphomonadaceae bacterium]|nr:sigma factor [Hyphomonadaceae bacterium]